MLTIAIDPGTKGALAMRCSDGRVVCQGLGETPKDIYDQLAFLAVRNAEVRAVVEKISTGVVQGGKNDRNAMSRVNGVIKLYANYREICMALIALDLPFDEVSPQKWMGDMGGLPKDPAVRKREIRDRMQRLHPSIKVTLQNADALAILAWHESTKKDQNHG